MGLHVPLDFLRTIQPKPCLAQEEPWLEGSPSPCQSWDAASALHHLNTLNACLTQEEPRLEVFTKFLSEEWPLPVAAAYCCARLLAGAAVLGITYLEYPSDRWCPLPCALAVL